MKLPSLSFLVQAFIDVCKRFPLALLSAGVGVVCAMSLVQDYDGRLTVKCWMFAQLALPVFTGLTALAESRNWPASEREHWYVQLGGVALLALYFWEMPDPTASDFAMVHGIRYMAFVLIAHLFVAVAPYLNRLPVADFWEYNKQLFANIVVGAVYTFILWAGVSVAILAVDQLFDINVAGETYVHLFILLAGIFNTAFFLFHFPKDYAFGEQDLAYNVVFKNLCKFILIPIVGLYFLILYAYSGKILISWSLPRGWVSSLVIGFSVVGIFTYLLNYLLPDYDESDVPRVYRRWFWWILLPMVALLFVAIGKRISDYGFTEERYFVADTGVWLLVCGLYFAFSKLDNIKFIPVSLAVFALLAVLGPLSAFSFAERSQVNILKNLLEKNGRLVDGKVKQGTDTIPNEDANRIYSALDFLDRRERLAAIQHWLPMLADSFPETTAAYGSAGRIAAWLGVSQGSNTATDEVQTSVSGQYGPVQGEIRGYSQFYRVELNDYRNENPKPGLFFDLSPKTTRIVLNDNKNGKITALDSFDLDVRLKQWHEKSQYGSYTLTDGAEWVDLKGRKNDIRILVQNINFTERKGHRELSNMSGLIFLKEKGR